MINPPRSLSNVGVAPPLRFKCNWEPTLKVTLSTVLCLNTSISEFELTPPGAILNIPLAPVSSSSLIVTTVLPILNWDWIDV